MSLANTSVEAASSSSTATEHPYQAIEQRLVQNTMYDFGALVDGSRAEGYAFIPVETTENVIRDLAKYAGVANFGVGDSLVGVVDALKEGQDAKSSAEKAEEDVERLNAEIEDLTEKYNALREEFDLLGKPVEATLLTPEQQQVIKVALRRAVETMNLIPGQRELTGDLRTALELLSNFNQHSYRRVYEDENEIDE